jgi:hypothetical protein
MARARIGDDAVMKKTGRVWSQWFALLDDAGAKKMDHKQIAEHLNSIGVPGWWAQMITVQYEQERGLRNEHQRPDGYSVGASRTFDAALGSVYLLWSDGKLRSKWLSTKLIVRKETRNKSMRITWPDKTSVDVYFYSKGPRKTQVAVQHNKLPGEADVDRARAEWKSALDRLSKLLRDKN